jgi:hypothetical protein
MPVEIIAGAVVGGGLMYVANKIGLRHAAAATLAGAMIGFDKLVEGTKAIMQEACETARPPKPKPKPEVRKPLEATLQKEPPSTWDHEG